MAKRKYNNDYVSVTTLLSQLASHGLTQWFKMTPYKQILEESDKAKKIGTQIHEAIKAHINKDVVSVDTEYPEEVMNVLKGFMLFKKDNPKLKFLESETALTSQNFRLNGTLDAVAFDEYKNVYKLVSWKTGKAKDEFKPTIYPEYRWQEAAYFMLYKTIVNTYPINCAEIVVFAKDKVGYNHTEDIQKNELYDDFRNIIQPLLTIYYYKREGVKNEIPA